VFSAQSWFEYWSSKFILLLGVFCLIVCFKRYVKTCRERDDAQKPLNCWSNAFGKCDPKKKALMGVSAGPKFDMGVRQNWTYLLSENMKIVSKRVSELPFFFDLCVRKNFWERTNKFEFYFLVEFHWLGWNSTLLFFEVTKQSKALFWLVMSQVTDSMCKYAHNRYFNNWSGDNASNKITCSLWDTLCILESLC